ncbi:MAG TPA: aldose 1-epimerase [Chloroflexota bacterium]|nr:aldose 1-epimerase [Chloroflexota bacterium]
MSEQLTTESARDSIWPGEVIILRDRESGSWAKILPESGCNLVGFGALVNGQEAEVMLQLSDENPSRPVASYGAPVLFPFPSRVRDGEAHFGGKTIKLDRHPGQLHAIHGLVMGARFRVERRGVGPDGAFARCSIVADPDRILRQFPFPFRHTLTWRLSGKTLRIDVEAENTGAEPMPMGFGWHPYFRLPLHVGGDRTAATIEVPASRQWVLEDSLVPTGETIPVPADRDFRKARAIGGIYFDDVYTAVDRSSGSSVCSITDPATGLTIRVAAGATFREWVVYAPPTRPTICFEPYTCPPDAFNLTERGIDAGVIVLKPGTKWVDWVEVRIG